MSGPPNRYYRSTRIRSDTIELLEKICEALRKRAEAGMPLPIRVELGKSHVLDQALRRMAKDIGVL